ncbi:MAG TPA: hypothetical protein VHH73_12400, partial [Verrucomicrobiae bacterium]|nr:hypothetical protein [Verrucomicrobiae bacterium]
MVRAARASLCRAPFIDAEARRMSALVPMDPNEDDFISSDGTDEERPAGFPVQRILAAVRRFWWIPLITTAVSLSVAVVYARRLPP